MSRMSMFVAEFNRANQTQALKLTVMEGFPKGSTDDLFLHDISSGRTANLPATEMQELLEPMLDADKKVKDLAGLWGKLEPRGVVRQRPAPVS
jgi:hypothetical protein